MFRIRVPGSATQRKNKPIFDIGGNKYRLIAVRDYEHHKLFVRFVLTHEEYDRGLWKQDTFGKDWKKQTRSKGEDADDQANPSAKNKTGPLP
jgi:hypothetical protein